MDDDTLRERLAEALTEHFPGYSDATCGCGEGYTGDVPHLVDALLPLIHEHVAAAVQADRERVLAVSESQELSFLERAAKAEAKLTAIRELAESTDRGIGYRVPGLHRVPWHFPVPDHPGTRRAGGQR